MSEAALHKAVAEFLNWTLKPPFFFTTFPSGGGGKVRGAQLKAMGLKAGVPDIYIAGPGGRTLWIELKTAQGRLSRVQGSIIGTLYLLGHQVEICRSVQEVQRVVSSWCGYVERKSAA